MRTEIENCQPARSKRSNSFAFQSPELAQELRAAGPGPLDAGDQLIGEAQDPALGVGRALAQTDVEDLAGVGAGARSGW